MQASGRGAKVLGCVFRGPNPGRLESPLSDTNWFCRASVGNNCQNYRGSRIAYAASAELGDVSSKANQRLHFFKKVDPLLNVPGKLAVYKAFVRPTMEYSCLVWMGASDTSLRQLDRVQRRALHSCGPGTYLPRLSHRRAVASLCYIYKLHYLANSHPLAAMLPPVGATHTRPTRQSATERHHYQLLSTNPAHTSLRHLRGFPSTSNFAVSAKSFTTTCIFYVLSSMKMIVQQSVASR